MEEQKTEGSCAKKCGGCKFMAGILAGLLLAGAGFGLYHAGRCGSGMKMCPMSSAPAAPAPSK